MSEFACGAGLNTSGDTSKTGALNGTQINKVIGM
jgi:hypothetical protein